MELKTYRVASLDEALAVIRRDLGPEASVLHSREVSGGLWNWFSGQRLLEVTASREMQAPCRLPPRASVPATLPVHALEEKLSVALPASAPPALTTEPASTSRRPFRGPEGEPASDYRARLHQYLAHDAPQADSLVERMSRGECEVRLKTPLGGAHLHAHLMAANLPDEAARWLVDRVIRRLPERDSADFARQHTEAVNLVAEELAVTGPLEATPGQKRVVALVGPTGVGKTTTIAKLAANLRLHQKLRVGLITVDTYRIAAIEQLRTYAEIIDLPLEVVTTPREMRAAVERLEHCDVVLLDTAGRSPRDAVQLQQLRAVLAEAQAHEVYLVLSATSHAESLVSAVAQFAPAQPTALVLTKLDEAESLGNLLPLVRASRLPVAYLTHGQNVPDDLRAAERRTLAEKIVGEAT